MKSRLKSVVSVSTKIKASLNGKANSKLWPSVILRMCNKVSPCTPTMSIQMTFQPLLWLNRILGMMVIELPEGVTWLKLSIFLFLVRMGFYMPLLFYTANVQPNAANSITIMVVVYSTISYISVIIVFVSSILALVNYKKPTAFFKRMTLADQTLEIFGIDPEYKEAYKINVRMVSFWWIGCLTILGTDIAVSCFFMFNNIYSAIITSIAFQIPLLVNPIVDLNFILIISCLGKRFERLNALIQSVTPSPNESIKNISKYENILKKNENKGAVKSTFYYNNRNNIELLLKVTRQLHLDLCDICRNVNDTFSMQMSMQMASTFLLFTGFSYCLYLIYNEPKIILSVKIQQFMSFGVYIIISIGRILYVVHTSVSVATEAQKTSQIAHEIQMTGSQTKLVDEVHQLSLQIMQHPLHFTASGLIVLDYGYVRGFVGSVTTYLMILIQNQPDVLKAAITLVEVNSDNRNVTNTTAISF